MEAQLFEKYSPILSQLTNCNTTDESDAFFIGHSRPCEVAEFVDAVMEDHTKQADNYHETTTILERFITFKEFEEVQDSRFIDVQSHILLQLLGVTNEQGFKKFKETFPPNREGYFKLMEVVNPQMRTFFFPALQYDSI